MSNTKISISPPTRQAFWASQDHYRESLMAMAHCYFDLGFQARDLARDILFDIIDAEGPKGRSRVKNRNGSDQKPWINQAALAKKYRCSLDSIQRAISRLVLAGYVSTVSQTTRFDSNCYSAEPLAVLLGIPWDTYAPSEAEVEAIRAQCAQQKAEASESESVKVQSKPTKTPKVATAPAPKPLDAPAETTGVSELIEDFPPSDEDEDFEEDEAPEVVRAPVKARIEAVSEDEAFARNTQFLFEKLNRMRVGEVGHTALKQMRVEVQQISDAEEYAQLSEANATPVPEHGSYSHPVVKLELIGAPYCPEVSEASRVIAPEFIDYLEYA